MKAGAPRGEIGANGIRLRFSRSDRLILIEKSRPATPYAGL
jgi:hypothetical protein